MTVYVAEDSAGDIHLIRYDRRGQGLEQFTAWAAEYLHDICDGPGSIQHLDVYQFDTQNLGAMMLGMPFDGVPGPVGSVGWHWPGEYVFVPAGGKPPAPSRTWMRENAPPGDEETGYDAGDPKHPAFHSVHADIWDSREGK